VTEPSSSSAPAPPVDIQPPTVDSDVVEDALVTGAPLIEPPAVCGDVGGNVLVHEAPLSEPPADGKKRKWTRRPVCPDDRCRRCWYIECSIPGGPKHTLDGMCLVTSLL
jgi:hypothetical protein